jgi:uncharacterized protein YndB with AHSA1/START domain
MTAAKKIGETTFTTPSDREIVMTRVFDAPRALVFDAYTNPEHLPHWFGPRGWTLPVCEIDLRPGGPWRFVLRGPDGTEMGMRGVYQEIAPPERLVSRKARPRASTVSPSTWKHRAGDVRGQPAARRSTIRSKKVPQPSFARSYTAAGKRPLCRKSISVRPSPRSLRTTVMSS